MSNDHLEKVLNKKEHFKINFYNKNFIVIFRTFGF